MTEVTSWRSFELCVLVEEVKKSHLTKLIVPSHCYCSCCETAARRPARLPGTAFEQSAELHAASHSAVFALLLLGQLLHLSSVPVCKRHERQCNALFAADVHHNNTAGRTSCRRSGNWTLCSGQTHKTIASSRRWCGDQACVHQALSLTPSFKSELVLAA